VFDVAGCLLVADVEDGCELHREEKPLDGSTPVSRAEAIKELGVDVLICGGISYLLENILASAGVRVIPHTCGPVEDILEAFLAGRLTESAFLMPGCRGRRRRRARGQPRLAHPGRRHHRRLP